MKQDAIVTEVRKAREAYAKEFNHDLKAIVDDLMRKQKASGRKIISRRPKKMSPNHST